MFRSIGLFDDFFAGAKERGRGETGIEEQASCWYQRRIGSSRWDAGKIDKIDKILVLGKLTK